MITLVGEPGIGKSRTSQELATYATLRNAQVLWGRCYEEQGVPPYWPWVQAIRSYVQERDTEDLRSVMGSGASDIAEIVGDISDSLNEILRRSESINQLSPTVIEIRTNMRSEYEGYGKDDGFPIKPQKLIYDLRQVMAPEDIVISDVGAHKMWIARHYHCERPNTCLISNGFAAMGIAIPGAIAAKLVYPERKVVAATGAVSYTHLTLPTNREV